MMRWIVLAFAILGLPQPVGAVPLGAAELKVELGPMLPVVVSTDACWPAPR